MQIIDRRRDTSGKSLVNRQRFIRRAKALVRQAVREASRGRSIADAGRGGEISVPADGVREPTFRHTTKGGDREYVLPGNKRYVEGDLIQRPPGGGGGGGRASGDGEGDDEFRFVLSDEEFIDVFLEDLELPDLAKREVIGEAKDHPRRAGFRSSGPPSALAVPRTMRNSLSRRIALRRPRRGEIDALEDELKALEGAGGDPDEIARLRAELDRQRTRARVIPFIDPLDVRYRRFEQQPKPVAQAVMFCLMDVSGSMDEHMKDLAKRFFTLLYLFLSRRYANVEVVFIRHTHEAKEVDEQMFFQSRESGGTVVSTALEEMARIVEDRFPLQQWNIYAAQASDGDNLPVDNAKTVALLKSVILPMCQYYAYIEVGQQPAGRGSSSEAPTSLWRAYELAIGSKIPMAMRKVRDRRDIYPRVPGTVRKEKPIGGIELTMDPDGGQLLYKGSEWNFDTLAKIHDAIEGIALNELGLSIYRNRIEVITSEQMLDAYASTGMPLFYKHWSFGKQFVRNEALYRKGWQGLAYEIVINSNPCVVYVMEENTATMQALVLAHAAFGHNHFFKNNYAFQQWTDADGILDYLSFAKNYVTACEERYGIGEVERVIDAAHALQSHGIDRYPGKRMLDLSSEERREQERREYAERMFNDLWRTVPDKKKAAKRKTENERRRALLGLPEENILYFLEKTAPRLRPWQREIIRIVRLIAQYFYPQRQTKMMNEGCATFTHYEIMTRLHERGQIDDGAFLEFLHSHTSVITQPAFDDPRHRGMNPYALGFAMTQDLQRLCMNPTAEDRQWFPEIAGSRDPYEVLKDVWANYRDESCILQFLSPAVIRSLGLFLVGDEEDEDSLSVDAIHNERGYLKVRRSLARLYDVSRHDPDIQIVDVDLDGDRRLELRHQVINGVTLDDGETERVLQHLANLWGYHVHMVETDESDNIRGEHHAEPLHPFQ